jgi:predicted DNA-binding WGR domain protein
LTQISRFIGATPDVSIEETIMDLEQIRKAMREGTFGQGVLDTKPPKDPKAPPPVVEEALSKKASKKKNASDKEPVVLSEVSLYFQQGKSDKVYKVITYQLHTGDYQVVAYWGRRTAVNLQSQIKYEGADRSAARIKVQDLESDKRKKGYK